MTINDHRSGLRFNVYDHPLVDVIFPDGTIRIIVATYYNIEHREWFPIKIDLDDIHSFIDELGKSYSYNSISDLVHHFFIFSPSPEIAFRMYKNVYGCDRVRERKLSDILEEVYPDVLEEIIDRLRLFVQLFKPEEEAFLRGVLNYIGEEKMIWKMTDVSNLTIEGEGVWKYTYNIGDTNYLRIPEESSVENTPLIIGITSKENSVVPDGFLNNIGGLREKLKIFLGSKNKPIKGTVKSNNIIEAVKKTWKKLWEKL